MPVQSQDALSFIPYEVPYLQAVSTLSLQGALESLSCLESWTGGSFL